MIELKNIDLKLNNSLFLNNLSINFEKEKFHILLGDTGSGKTLILELIVGLKKYNSGNILLEGVNIDNLSSEKRSIAYVPQDNSLFPHLSVYENIFYGLRFINSLTNKEKKEKIYAISNILKIEHLLNRNINFLSGGEKQRIALARALVIDKNIILLDEPTSSLNETLQEELCFFLKELQKKYNLTIIMTTHNINNAFILADYIHFIDKGKILYSSLKKDIYNLPINIKFAKFLGIKNIFEIEQINTNKINLKGINLDLSIKRNLPNNTSFVSLDKVNILLNKDLEYINTFNLKIIDLIYKKNSLIIKAEEFLSKEILYIEIPFRKKNYNIEIGNIIKVSIKEENIIFISN